MADRTHQRTLASVQRLIGDGACPASDASDPAGEHYAAHQKARTTAARLLKAPTTPEKQAQATDLLWSTARQLLEKGEAGSGTDLGLYLIEAWVQDGTRCGDAERSALVAAARTRLMRAQRRSVSCWLWRGRRASGASSSQTRRSAGRPSVAAVRQAISFCRPTSASSSPRVRPGIAEPR